MAPWHPNKRHFPYAILFATRYEISQENEGVIVQPISAHAMFWLY